MLKKRLGFMRRGYLTGTYNGVLSSKRQASPYDFDLLNGVGIGLALDTMIGPMRATGGLELRRKIALLRFRSDPPFRDLRLTNDDLRLKKFSSRILGII